VAATVNDRRRRSSLLIWHHFAFLAISLALLGFSAVLLPAAACYAVAAVVAWRWPVAEPAPRR
jgi:hypothetical protein